MKEIAKFARVCKSNVYNNLIYIRYYSLFFDGIGYKKTRRMAGYIFGTTGPSLETMT